MKTVNVIDTATGPVMLGQDADMLRDEVIGKLVHDNILVSMESVGFQVQELNAKPDRHGGVFIIYGVHLDADELAALPSIYDAPPAPVKKARKRRSK